MFNAAVQTIARNPQKHFTEAERGVMRSFLSKWNATYGSSMAQQTGALRAQFELTNRKAAAVVLAWNLYLL